jgi:MoxR-like ATPase
MRNTGDDTQDQHLPQTASVAVSRTATSTAAGKHGGTVTQHPRPTRGLVCIFPRRMDEAARVWTVQKPATIGRSHQAVVRLDDQKVSRLHAEVEPGQQGLVVRDRGSRHGTFVNGRPVGTQDVKVADGDLMRVGDSLLLVVGDVAGWDAPPRSIRASALGLHRDVLAGPRLAEVIDQAARVAELDYPILVLGESGSGKEIIARVIHATRPNPGPFVGLNMAAVPASLFEAELFGHERGAFTGANVARLGAFREANGGVLFLDEVADLTFDLQAKLLRAIDLQRVRPIGASADVTVKVRVVAATSRNLHALCESDRFRPDLYYRLAGVVIQVPPLRERRDEILLLALGMIADDSPGLRLTADAAEMLATAPWKGNVRNLRRAMTHAISSAVAAKRKDIFPSDLPDLQPIEAMAIDSPGLTPERLRAAMLRAGGVAWRAAEELGIPRSTFYNTCKRFGLKPRDLRGR